MNIAIQYEGKLIACDVGMTGGTGKGAYVVIGNNGIKGYMFANDKGTAFKQIDIISSEDMLRQAEEMLNNIMSAPILAPPAELFDDEMKARAEELEPAA